jgi:hypothetical protein
VFNYKQAYTSPKHFLIEGKSNGFFPATPNFLFSNLFLIFSMFLGLKLLQRVTSRFRLSKVLKEFKYWPFLFLMIFEGNTQHFAYLLTFDFQNFFAVTLFSKAINILTLIIGFVLIFFCGFFYFLLKPINK